jgi:hypothetical protein
MSRISSAQPTDDWETLTSNCEAAASEHPGLAAGRAELTETLAEAKRSRNVQSETPQPDATCPRHAPASLYSFPANTCASLSRRNHCLTHQLGS